MSEFLVEVYAPRAAEPVSAREVEQVARAADQLTREGIEVRFLRAIFVREDETCFYLYQASSLAAVAEAAARAGLRVERLAEATFDPVAPAAEANGGPLAAPHDGLAQANTHKGVPQ